MCIGGAYTWGWWLPRLYLFHYHSPCHLYVERFVCSSFETVCLKHFGHCNSIYWLNEIRNSLQDLTYFLWISLIDALPSLRQFLANECPLKRMKNVFLFHLKSSFRSQSILIFVLTFWWCRKTAWLERLLSRFLTSQSGKQAIAVFMLPNISRSKGNQAMKFWSVNRI